MPLTVDELSQQLGLDYEGSTDALIESIASFSCATSGQLTFLNHDKNLSANNQNTDAIVITDQASAEKISAKAIIFSDHPQLSFARAIPLVIAIENPSRGVHDSAQISDDAIIDPSAAVMPNAVIEADVVVAEGAVVGSNVFIGKGTRIGKHTRIDSNVSIYANTQIGEDCRVGAGSVIGSPGFGIVQDGKQWARFPQVGKVIIGDSVDIGANCCIDRGAIEDTIIGSGVKLDNLIQIAHNVQIGDNTVIAACTGIAGSAKIGENCQIGGRASIQGHIRIADNVVITTCTFVNKSIPKPGVYSSSISMQENSQWLKNHARLKRLDKISRQVNQLENTISQSFLKGERSGK